MTTEKQYSSNRDSSSIMEAVHSPAQVDEFMKTSFYLPVDILKDERWQVMRMEVITGEEFRLSHVLYNPGNLHCTESITLLDQARFVGVSNRWNKAERRMYGVAKIWYGRLPKGGLT